MKKGKKLLMVICAALMLTGCTPKELKTAYNNMKVGEGNDEINGYSLNIRLFGLYKDNRIGQSIRVENYLGKNFKVTDTSDDDEINYYVIDGVSYKQIIEDTEENESTEGLTEEEILEQELSRYDRDLNYEKTSETVPFLDTDLYLTSLKYAKDVSDAKEEEIGELKYTTYSYTISKRRMLDILKGSDLEDIEFTENVPVEVWIDSEGYVYKIEYDLATAIGSSSVLALNVYYNRVNTQNEISLDDFNVID